MYADPGDSTLLSRLETIEHRINELTRRRARTPRCLVRLGVDVEVWSSDSMNVLVNTSWETTPDVDTDGMWHPGTDAYVEAPFAGRWRILVHSKWRAALNYRGDFPNSLSSSVLLNGTDPATSAIAEETTFHHPESTVTITLVSEDRLLESGDQLKFNFWSRYAGPRMHASTIGDYTHFAITYLGDQ